MLVRILTRSSAAAEIAWI